MLSHYTARSSRCIDPLHFYNLLKSTSTASPRAKLASLVKGEVLSPEKIRATTGGIVTPPSLAPHQPSQNRTIPLAFRRVRVCVRLVGFASIAIVVVCGRCVTASSAISVAASCSDSHLCRCIVQRLCVADFMHPCIPTFCDHL